MKQDPARAFSDSDSPVDTTHTSPGPLHILRDVTATEPNQPSSSAYQSVKVKYNLSPPRRSDPVAIGDDVEPDLSEIEDAARSGLLRIRGGIECLVDEERMRLRSARSEALGAVARLSGRQGEERERLRHVNRKLAEKQDSYYRASEEYELALAALVSAEANDQRAAPREVSPCKESLDLALKRLRAWNFKAKQQTTALSKVTEELASAEEISRATCAEIDTEMEEMRSVSIFLMGLDV